MIVVVVLKASTIISIVLNTDSGSVEATIVESIWLLLGWFMFELLSNHRSNHRWSYCLASRSSSRHLENILVYNHKLMLTIKEYFDVKKKKKREKIDRKTKTHDYHVIFRHIGGHS